LHDLLARLLGLGNGFRVEAVSGCQAAVARALEMEPDVVIGAWDVGGFDGLELLRKLREHATTRSVPVILLAGKGTRHEQAWECGVDALLIEPVETAELVARVRSLAARRRLEELELRRVRQLEESVSRLVDLALALSDAAIPGLSAHGDAVARLAERLAERFDVPDVFRRDLLIAARLHAIAKPMLSGSAPADSDPARLSTATSAELRVIPVLADAAGLVASSGEHWDGTGRPAGLQRGQIPLRARIIRVAVDLVDAAARNPGAGLAGALPSLRPHAGTHYDPAVFAEAESLAQDGAWEVEGVERLVLDRLEPGMLLEEDLVTASGVKLLARGGVLTSASLAAVGRRHVTDPIVHAVKIRRPRP
jgi:response regulator RpfG family c-di-GMP phosphodiesterase